MSAVFVCTGVRLALIAAGVGILARPALAAEEIEEIVVLGTYLDDRAFRSESQITVERAELEAMMPAGPEQLLQRLPGIAVYRPGGSGGVSEIFLRGAESNFTAVFVDGVRLNNPANTRGGSFDFSTLAVNEVERVDIGMGAMSAIYGSDAMAGVIWIESGWPEVGGGTAFLEAGTEGDWRTGAAATLGFGGTTALGVRASRVDGGDEINGMSQELGNLSARLAGQLANGDRWQVNLRHVERQRTSFPEVSGGPELAVLPDLETTDGEETSLSAMIDWTPSARWQAEIIASWAELEDEIDTPAVPPGALDGQPAFTTVSQYRRGQLLWINRLAIDGPTDLALGIDLVTEDGRDDGTVDLGFAVVPNSYRLDRNTAAAFLEWGYAGPKGLEVTLAGRLDHSEDESRASGKFGLARRFSAVDGVLWASIADGFKLPSFFALGNPLFGNPTLVWEKVTSFEVGYDQDLSNGIEAGISLFASKYEDLVDFDFETFRNINRGQVDITGVFLYLQTQITPTVWLGADATLSDISSDSGPLRRRPENTGGVGLTWRPNDVWSIDMTARFIDERLTTSIPTGDVVDGAYWVADATARYQHSQRYALWLAIDNAFDSNYQDAPGFPAPGWRARLGAGLCF